jgi:hypothetical protein
MLVTDMLEGKETLANNIKCDLRQVLGGNVGEFSRF